MPTPRNDERSVTRTYRAAVRLGEDFITLEETVTLPLDATDEEVQKAVNRIQPEALTLDAIAAGRAAGYRSISIDLIYGLPRQSVATMTQTLDKVIAASPDRISVYNYAHMPALFKSQRLIDDNDLPPPQVKLDMLALCIGKLTGAGYVYIGMDHFARPDDELAIAQREGGLQRGREPFAQLRCVSGRVLPRIAPEQVDDLFHGVRRSRHGARAVRAP